MDLIKRFSAFPASSSSEVVRTLSIDLGTTNSTVAESVWLPGYPPLCRVLDIEQPLDTGSFRGALVPSMVAVTGGDRLVVGEGARRLRQGPRRAERVRDQNFFYETKNEMGLQRTYAGAPEYLNQAYKVAGYILGFLMEGAMQQTGAAPAAVSVTVPASFQLNQRRDTLRACGLADLHLQEADLLEEPVAALIDYIMADRTEALIPPAGEARYCVVFDFGGGTCDVSVLSLAAGAEKRLSLSQLSVSRYHRLGGGDIDVCLVHEVLLPDLLAENNLGPGDLSWSEKKRELEPQLVGAAEALKIDLCRRISEQEKQGVYRETDKEALQVAQPPLICWAESGELRLSHPQLTAAAFEAVLAPFLDEAHLYARETEYQLTQSVFSPLEDALDRAGLEPAEVDFFLMTGGSSLIPQVRTAVTNFFPNAVQGYYEDPLAMQTAVARGAAWNTTFTAATGRPLIQPVLHDGLALLTDDDAHCPLVAPATPLPWPADGSYKRVRLVVPGTGALFVDALRLTIVGQTDERHVYDEIWSLPEAARPGDEIVLEYRLTAAKQLECRAVLCEAEEAAPLTVTIENPLVNVVNPGSIRLQIEAAEERLRRKDGGSHRDRDEFVQLARWYAELEQQEKALHYLHTALKKLDGPDEIILNLQGQYYWDLTDYERAEKAYQEADRVSRTWGGPLFNLALMYRDTGRCGEALSTVEQALEKEREEKAGPYRMLKAQVLKDLERTEDARAEAEKALEAFSPLEKTTDWELGWYNTAALYVEDTRLQDTIRKERQRRRQEKASPEMDADTPRPVMKPEVSVYQNNSAA